MAVPELPHRIRSSPIIGPQYEAWKAKVQADGMDEAAIKHEFYTVMKPRWIEQQRQNDKFEAETEKLRKKTEANHDSTEHLRSAKQHRFAVPITLHGGTLTPLEVLVYGSESGHPPYNRLMRDAQSIVIRTPLVRPDWLGTNGFLVDSPQFIKFITLLYAETMATVPNQQAAGLYDLLTSNNHDGKSAFKRIVLRTGEPVPFNPVRPLMAELPHAHGDAMLSHKFLTTTLAINAFGTPKFLPSKTLTGAAQEYLAASENLIQNDCAYRCLLESFKNSWDAWEAKKQSQRKKPGNMCLLDHGFLRTVFGKTDEDYSLKIHELGKFFSDPKRKLSCVVVDDWGNIIWKKVWDTQTDNITPHCLYLLAHNQHLYVLPRGYANLRENSVGIKENETHDAYTTPSSSRPTYRVCAELDTKWILCDTIGHLEAVLREVSTLKPIEEAKKTRLHAVKVHYSGGMKECFTYFRDRNYYPQVVIRKDRVAELRCLNLNGSVNMTITCFSIEGEPSLVRRKL